MEKNEILFSGKSHTLIDLTNGSKNIKGFEILLPSYHLRNRKNSLFNSKLEMVEALKKRLQGLGAFKSIRVELIEDYIKFHCDVKPRVEEIDLTLDEIAKFHESYQTNFSVAFSEMDIFDFQVRLHVQVFN